MSKSNEQRAPVEWTREGRTRRCDEGIFAYKIVPQDERRKALGDDRGPSSGFAIMRGLSGDEQGAEGRFCFMKEFLDEREAVAAAERDILALKALGRREMPKGHAGTSEFEAVFEFAPGLLVDGGYGHEFRLSEDLVARLPVAFRKRPRGGVAVYKMMETELIVASIPELFTPLEIEQADGVLDEFPGFRKLMETPAPAVHDLLRAHLSLDRHGWKYDLLLRIVSVGRPDVRDRMRVVMGMDELRQYGPSTFYDLRKGDRLVVMVPADELGRPDFALDFSRHEIVDYQQAAII